MILRRTPLTDRICRDAPATRRGRLGYEHEGTGPGGTSYPSDSTLGPTNATAVCCSYPPNRWGLYDMHGNIQELCLDWFESGYLGSTYNISKSDPKKTAGGVTGSFRCRRGGSFILKAFDPYAAGDCRASSRTGVSPKAPYVNLGGRVACRAGLR